MACKTDAEVIEILKLACPQIQYLIEVIQSKDNPLDFVTFTVENNKDYCPYFNIVEVELNIRRQLEGYKALPVMRDKGDY